MRRKVSFAILTTLLLAGCGQLAFQPAGERARQAQRTARSERTTKDAQRDDARRASPSAETTRAVCVLTAVGESGVSGIVHFTQRGSNVEIHGKVTGLTPGKHGFHVHQYGDLSDLEKGSSAGGHYNPLDTPHGRPTDEERHVGDLGNIEADENGTAEIQIKDPVIQLNGPHSIVGRALVVHSKEDQFTQPSGDAGDRVAFGVIGVAEPKQP